MKSTSRCPSQTRDVTDWREYVYAWKDHFIQVMKPRFLPAGWDIVSVTNLEAVARSFVDQSI